MDPQATISGGVVKTLGSYGTQNGGFFHPLGIAFDKNGNIAIADMGNNRIQLFSSAGAWLKTIGHVALPKTPAP